MLRRLFLKSAMASAIVFGSTGLAWAADTGPRVDVVKIMSLTCPVCRIAESQDGAIERAVREAGGKFVFAPLPTEEEASSGAKERVYYAAREIDPNMAAAIKQSLYKGSQDMGVQLLDYLQVYTWLSQDLPQYEPKFNLLFEKAQDSAAKGSISRAAALATKAGVTALPGYVILVDGQVTSLADPNSVPGNSILALRDEVIARVRKLSTQ